jgi:RNA polymerase sigma-70 factor (ECF subfamily)
MSTDHSADAEARFAKIFSHLAAVAAYAQRRGSADPHALAAEAMTIAWRKLDAVPRDDPLPWLYATAGNLLLAEARRARTARSAQLSEPPAPAPDIWDLDPALDLALRSLSPLDREALLLIAWEDLTPAQAARALGVSPATFRVRLYRARRRAETCLRRRDPDAAKPSTNLKVEKT